MKNFNVPPYGRRETFDVVLKNLLVLQAPRILEIGMIWNENIQAGAGGDGWSTLMLAYAAGMTGGKLTSIDINPTAVGASTRLLDRYGLSGDHVELVQAEAIEFCSKFDEPLDLLYLDGGSSRDLAVSARSAEGVGEHHWEIFAPLERLIKPGGYVMFDDQPVFEPTWSPGKGKIVIPYLLKKGWTTVVRRYTYLIQSPRT